jgi:hypothetical protein
MQHLSIAARMLLPGIRRRQDSTGQPTSRKAVQAELAVSRQPAD